MPDSKENLNKTIKPYKSFLFHFKLYTIHNYVLLQNFNTKQRVNKLVIFAAFKLFFMKAFFYLSGNNCAPVPTNKSIFLSIE